MRVSTSPAEGEFAADVDDSPDYEWTPVWRSILSLAGFVVARIDDLRQLSANVDMLISQVS